MIYSLANDFIPPEIADNITCLTNPDHHEREGYTVSLESGNYENDLQAAQGENFLPDESDPLITGSVCTDINGETNSSECSDDRCLVRTNNKQHISRE